MGRSFKAIRTTPWRGSTLERNRPHTAKESGVISSNRLPTLSQNGAVLMPTITATFEDGVLKPAQPLNLPDHAQVRITIEIVEPDL